MTDEKERVDLRGAPQTMLATLYAKALDADLPEPILGDGYAKAAVARIDYDWRKTTITAARSPSVTTRTAHFDDWAGAFLAANPDAVVLHVGCGLDSRFFRLQPGPGVDWYDIDHSEVADLRRRLLPQREHNHVVAASVTDPAWFAEIPTGRPTLMLGEGLTMYLAEQDGIALLRRVVEHCGSGELQFDAFSRLGIKTQWANAVVRRSGATLQWGIDEPREILAAVPGTRLLECVCWFESDTYQKLPRRYRALGKAMSLIPAAAKLSRYHRYVF